jgi:hypothetical protein
MAKLTAEGNVKVYRVESVSDPDAPTAAEIDGGVNLTPFLPTSGVSISWNNNNASIDMLDEGFTAEVVGTRGVSISLTGVRDDESDDFFDAFAYQDNFYLVISRFGEPSAGDSVEVYRCQSHDPAPSTPATNEFQTAEVQLAVQEAYARATVA